MDATQNQTRWLKMGNIPYINFIGRDYAQFGSGCYLNFIHLGTCEESFYTANNPQTGHGVSCSAGHRNLRVFAFAEHCLNPRIFVMTCPELKIVSILEDGCREGYLYLSFSEGSMLLSLGNLPSFEITVWNWRTAEKLGSSKSKIFRHDQVFRCNHLPPVILAQLAYKTTIVNLWDIHKCGKKCIMTNHVVRIPETKPLPFNTLVWNNDNVLFLLDTLANVYVVDSNTYQIKILIENPKVPNLGETSMALVKGGLAVAGPDSNIRHYAKSPTGYVQDWSIPSQELVYHMRASRSDDIVTTTEKKNIYLYPAGATEPKILRYDESQFNDFCLLYPTGEYIVTLCQSNFLQAYHIPTGKRMSRYDLVGTTLCMASNPEFPYVAVGYVNGFLELISFYNPMESKLLTSFHLTHHPLTSVYFSEFGRVFVCAYLSIGELFVLEGIPGNVMNIIACVQTNMQIADYILVPSSNCYRLFVIPVTSGEYVAGNKIIRYCIMSKTEITKKEYYFPEKDAMYFKLCSTAKINRDRVFYAMPFGKKCIHEIEVKRGEDSIQINEVIPTAHQNRNIVLQLDKHHAVTYGFDGFVFVRSLDFEELIGIALPHHRLHRGIKRAVVDPYGKYVVSFGRDDVLVCTDLIFNHIDETKQKKLQDLQNSARFAILFKKPTTGFVGEGSRKDLTWLEMEKLLKIEEEKKACAEERASILKEFEKIKKELKSILKKNLEGPANEKLELLEFNLDTKHYEELKEKTKIECKITEQTLKKDMVAQYKVAEMIKKLCWEPIAVKRKVLYAISNSTGVENYAMLPVTGADTALLAWHREYLLMEQFLATGNTFEPWTNYSQTELDNLAKQRTKFPAIKKTDLHDLEEDEGTKPDVDTMIAEYGSTALLFTERGNRYHQKQINSFLQLDILNPIVKFDNEALKAFFNKEFETLFAQKERDVNMIKDRNARLRYIISEINYFSVEQLCINLDDPIWTQEEYPEKIIKVEDKEVIITPYISPSQQAILDAKAAEEERQRLLMLADDFRERALQVMMNGVLEVRWEDELKKEVPIPKCMIEKEPEHFNEEDIRAAKEYEDKVKFLQSERERYKVLLEAEYAKICQQIREVTRKFNGKLHDLLLLRIKVDSALTQENLILSIKRLLFQHRMDYLDKELEIKKNILTVDGVIKGIHQLIVSLHEPVQECRAEVDTLQNREKILEKGFKREFIDASVIVQEQASKLYKKRPKINYKAISNITLLLTLARAVTSNERSILLTAECLDFLEALDVLDQFVGLPPMIDEHIYSVICRHRRLRIEHELKVKAMSVHLAEAEATVSNLHKRLASKKELNVQNINDLNQLRIDYLHLMQNFKVQIVVKQGYIEVPMTGSISDFKDAVLVHRKDVEKINDLIIECGTKKLKSMRHAMSFRREIMKKEWEHKKLRMQIEDLKEQLGDIQRMKVTKEMQSFLRGKEKLIPFEAEVDLIKASYENIIKEYQEKEKRVMEQVNEVKEKSKALDKQIVELNVDVCEYTLAKDFDLEASEKPIMNKRMQVMLKRTRMVQDIQENHNEILALQTELELLRLRTYPTLKYKIFN